MQSPPPHPCVSSALQVQRLKTLPRLQSRGYLKPEGTLPPAGVPASQHLPATLRNPPQGGSVDAKARPSPAKLPAGRTPPPVPPSLEVIQPAPFSSRPAKPPSWGSLRKPLFRSPTKLLSRSSPFGWVCFIPVPSVVGKPFEVGPGGGKVVGVQFPVRVRQICCKMCNMLKSQGGGTFLVFYGTQHWKGSLRFFKAAEEEEGGSEIRSIFWIYLIIS